ncbi:MAG: chloride channel protein [Solirubrobacterales bacterium]|nr:chloride channel protein [Solirubrobacterales bacterium]
MSATSDGAARRGLAGRLHVQSTWLAASRLGLALVALAVGAGAGLGAVGFRWLIFTCTWLITGHEQFGQQGHAPSAHLPWLGIWFVLLVPVLGGLLYGPLIQRFAREARGHGVPEVMVAVAENGGRIRPPVTIVKALASAITIAVGGSVGREGPIVQIGSALGSTLGQGLRMSEARLRVIVACGAAGGIAATFNAPITGLFFGFEIVLREFSLDALVATALAAVTGDVVSRAVFGSAPFFAVVPHGLTVGNDLTYLLVAVLAIAAGVIGVGFKTFLYGFEDRADRIWRGRPEWARPAVGGILLGVVLLALPQMYGVGYPVMDAAIAGHVVIGLVLLFCVGKIVATSLTLAIGGSGGVFAPSLFIGAMAGTAFGAGANAVFGPEVGPPALYAVVAMGGVFAAAAQAPLTAIASVIEMTANFTLSLPIMLACGIAAAISKHFSYGSVYTTKLLRRGIDIERPRLGDVLRSLTVADVMAPVARPAPPPGAEAAGRPTWGDLRATVVGVGRPQELFEEENLEQALRQLALYGPAGLPVLYRDRARLQGWITRQAILRVLAGAVDQTERTVERGAVDAELGAPEPEHAHRPPTPLQGHRVLEVIVDDRSPLRGTPADEVRWPRGAVVVGVNRGAQPLPDRAGVELRGGDRVILLADGDAPGAASEPDPAEPDLAEPDPAEPDAATPEPPAPGFDGDPDERRWTLDASRR